MERRDVLTLDATYDRIVPRSFVVVDRTADEGSSTTTLASRVSRVDTLYDDWFIETCRPWAVPYLGEVVGYEPAVEAGDPPADDERSARRFGPHWGSKSSEGFDPSTPIDPFKIAYRPEKDGAKEDLSIGLGRYHVNGIPCQNESGDVSYFAQPDYPALRGETTAALPDEGVLFLVYLHAWERHLAPYERSRPSRDRFAGIDPMAQVPALRGLAPTSRTKVVWQVKVLTRANDLKDFKAKDPQDLRHIIDPKKLPFSAR